MSVICIAALALVVLVAACGNGRATYVDEMNAICRSAKARVEAIPRPVDPATQEIDRERAKRINARLAASARQTEAELRAVQPPDEIAREHADLLAAVGEIRKASVRLNQSADRATRAYARRDDAAVEAASREFARAVEASNAASERAERVAARLGLDDCREADG